ncbi:hypothetical protein BRYFOR_07945 [Marvinbryantia formatexigens DSM 14469]|uniref:Uncharacterized protein n=1 Tax=Marvinbryantia formatexigens DSM 14469 TaxID=478749 RepID=C6LH35_9FIRM|nr:hypothetical protein [Marvinbryantia formatexigens]EET60094.1 hypothetical protein BRYFOR_07945 [Marvinbryantia formatexigens DSM 14469]UWO23882.1 hypothetical protein NQ534_15760 [Marvinbryantia formatexigens DSM 14469]
MEASLHRGGVPGKEGEAEPDAGSDDHRGRQAERRNTVSGRLQKFFLEKFADVIEMTFFLRIYSESI